MESFEVIQQKTKCNWCGNLMIMSEPISDANFIDTGKVFISNGEKAYALYCSDCLAVEARVKQPKSATDKETLEEFTMDRLAEPKDAKQKQEQELETENH